MTLADLVASVVMVGHSLFGPDNPVMLEQLLAQQPALAAGQTEDTITVEAQIINGAPLSYNWAHADQAEGINARNRLADGIDVLIVTEAIPLANHLKWSDTEGALAEFYTLAHRANPEVEVYLQETWHSLSSGTGVEVPFDAGAAMPWRDRLSTDLPRWQSVVDTVNRKTGGSIKLLKAGQAMARLDDAIQAGTVPGLTGIEEVFADDIHPNDLGFYFLSVLQYAVLTGQSPVGLPHQLRSTWGGRYKAPAPALARRLQEIAWDAARERVQRASLPSDPLPLPTDPVLPALNQPLQTSQTVASDAVTAQTEAAVSEVPKQPIAMNLASIADWSPQAPFLDHFKTARPWIGHIAGQWGGADYSDLAAAGYLDPDGWPTAIPPELGSVGTLILTDLPKEASSLTGRYVLRFEGDGIIEVTGRARNIRYGKSEIRFDYTPGPGAVEIRIQRSDRQGVGDYVRNITVVMEKHLPDWQAGALFNPDWIARMRGFAALRFMDWMATNDSTQVGWEDRPRVQDYSWTAQGAPAEVLVALANHLQADPWFTLPHMADDIYIRNYARLVRDQLDPELTAYVEYSNEVWNWQFEQAVWADDQARARWGGQDLWMQFYGGRAAEVAMIWTDVFGDAAEDRLVRVVATQTGWLGLEEQILAAPLWVAEDPARRPPAQLFDAYAVTGYFGGILGLPDRAATLRAWIAQSREQAAAAAEAKGLSGAAAAEFVEAHQYDAASALAAAELRDGLVSSSSEDTVSDLLGRILPYHAKVAEAHGLDLIMYEGGSHVVGLGAMVDDEMLTGFFSHFNYTEEMGALYRSLLAGWPEIGGRLFTAYSDVSSPGKWGSWGSLRYVSDDNPRWRALEAAK
ncbi:hypothetical protein [Phaeobacter gallaeciensis]|uniref:hypothetical protein n=1 Tax=Phaeobacter gallaeciensis TaxID=60890 RepID=UPI000BBBE62F|nr:hypothetical protein [Phaeobacter gallaeciensis]ATF19428.1 hypothetical protein PhaeoP129_02818 [Phaeobacter gallaeciensis]ATF23537.1 hypothetical protein PhaeoP128_02819 [Phaeobacter gallaeciensis]